jgi:PadR family transcriptional regulator PadR
MNGSSILTFWALGLLLRQPMYGLEIKKAIENSTQGKMKLGASTIYQLMRRLEKRGLAVSRWERTEQGPPRAYYELTNAGREVVFRYAAEVLSPASPISAALGELTLDIFEQLKLTEEKETETSDHRIPR